MACIEILSPEDTLRRMQERIDDYRRSGVANIWILDPATQRGHDCQVSGFLDAIEFKIPNTPIRLICLNYFFGFAEFAICIRIKSGDESGAAARLRQ